MITDNYELQQLLNKPDAAGEVHLPTGEFEGPFSCNVPCHIIGNNTTLWRSKGAVLNVSAEGVTLENLRVEVTGDSISGKDNAAIFSRQGDTSFINVEVIGSVAGIEGEDNPRGLPKLVDLGVFPAEQVCTWQIKVIASAATEILSLSHDISITPSYIEQGKNTLTITVAPIRSGSYIYGEVLFRSKVTRRAYLSGSADENISGYEDGRTVFAADEEAYYSAEKFDPSEEEFVSDMLFPDEPAPAPRADAMYTPEPIEETPPELHSLYLINRGMRVNLNGPTAEIELIYDNKDFPMDVDAFAFMADKNGNVTQNDRFVFFGNDHSSCGGVRYLNAPDKKVMYVNFNILPLDVTEIDIAYSIYSNPHGLNFSHLKNPAIQIKLADGQQLIYRLEPPLAVGTLVGIEMSYNNSKWELTPLGMIYPPGLERLCENYGLKIQQ